MTLARPLPQFVLQLRREAARLLERQGEPNLYSALLGLSAKAGHLRPADKPHDAGAYFDLPARQIQARHNDGLGQGRLFVTILPHEIRPC